MEWLNYHHLLYFWTVAKEGGLAPAGAVLRLSPSALSGQIHRLEEVLGHDLFAKRGRKLEMTELGKVVFRYADEIFGLGRELMNTLREQPTGRAARLRVGISDVVPKLLVRRLLGPVLQGANPWRLTCFEDRFERLLEQLGDHAIDVLITDAPVPPDSNVRAFNHILGESTVSMLAPKELATALRRGFPASVEGAPLLLPLPGSALRRALDGWFERHGVAGEVVAEAEDSALLKAFAADAMGALFVPTVIASTVATRYGLTLVAELDDVRERFYAISGERKLVHPAVVAIRADAKTRLFG